MKPRNDVARRLADRLFHQRRIKSKKGKGSFSRRPKHKASDGGLLFGIGARRCWQVWSLWNSAICAR
jgi:hypothetical protein